MKNLVLILSITLTGIGGGFVLTYLIETYLFGECCIPVYLWVADRMEYWLGMLGMGLIISPLSIPNYYTHEVPDHKG